MKNRAKFLAPILILCLLGWAATKISRHRSRSISLKAMSKATWCRSGRSKAKGWPGWTSSPGRR